VKATPADVLRIARADAARVSTESSGRALLRLLKDAEDDLAARIAKRRELVPFGPDGTFTSEQMRVTLTQLREVTRNLVKKLGPKIADSAEDVAGIAGKGVLTQLAASEREFRGINAALPIDEAATLDAAVDGSRASVLRRLMVEHPDGEGGGILQRYGFDVVRRFERQLSIAVATRKPFDEVKGALVDESPFLQGAPRFWAERIARTEMHGAFNRAAHKAMTRAEEDVGPMLRILVATFDERTAPDSWNVHGELRKASEPFEYVAYNGEHQAFMTPPNRPNDREVVVAHMAHWPIPEGLKPKSDAEVEKAYAKAKQKYHGRPKVMASVDLSKKPALTAAQNVLGGEKIAGAKGSNEGGVYRGVDGKERYVKFYQDPSQAYGEQLANRIYSNLGIGAPSSQVFEHDGKSVYASDMVGGRTLQDAGLTTARAREVASGFAADVLVGNWDVVGLNLDNIMVADGGGVVRLDNGGSFLMRAKEGRKPVEVLNKISEWDKFFSSSNPSYSKVMNAAGYASPAAMREDVIAQIGKIAKLRDESGGWQKYVERNAPGLEGADKKQIVDMLDVRTRLLEEKVEAFKNAPADPTQPVIGHLPKKALPAATMPVPVIGKAKPSAEQRYLDRVRRHRGKNDEPMDRMLQIARYQAVASERLPEGHPGVGAVENFTGSFSGRIRQYEQFEAQRGGEFSAYEQWRREKNAEGNVDARYGSRLSRDQFAEARRKAGHIHDLFTDKRTKATPDVMVYRGIHSVADADFKRFASESEFRFDASTSTSRTPGVAMSFGNIGSSSSSDNRVLFVLKQKHALAIEHVSGIETEDELLLHKSARFRVTSRHQAEDHRNVLVIEAEQIDEGPKGK
jgi:NAD:arginine ADP-ribosyltransferase